MRIAVLSILVLFLFSSISYSSTRCLDENILKDKQVKDKNIIWKLPKDARTVTFYYKDKRGRVIFFRTFEVDGNYILEMKVNDNG